MDGRSGLVAQQQIEIVCAEPGDDLITSLNDIVETLRLNCSLLVR
jgi:hypothetical protein